ncbi:MAG: hypothetical protein U1F76_03500 [Candidatus Competibacteraceae bacterium]
MIGQLARLAWGLPAFIRRPLNYAEAVAALKLRLADRAGRFLRLAQTHIYGNPSSPYRALLAWAGCEYGDLAQNVRRHGLEPTLAQLRDAGVYVSLAEFKARTPIQRSGLWLQPREDNFDNPFFTATGLEATTSGSRSHGSRVVYDWALFHEQAANELILNELHGVRTAPLVLWLPTLPAIAGVSSAMMNVRFRRVPLQWFSQTDWKAGGLLSRHRLAMEYLLGCCRLLGQPLPRPEFADFSHAGRVAEWIATTKRKVGPPLLRTYVSSAVRLAQAAHERGLDISGSVILSAGEPLTERRCRFIEATGARVFPRYSATEAGLIGAACPYRTGADDMHIYVDRLAVIQRAESFLFTSLSPHTGKVLFNTDIGDTGALVTRRCSCAFGDLGMETHVVNVRSRDKLTGEGMAILATDLDEIIGALIEQLGGSPDDYQFWETDGQGELTRLKVAIHPRLENLDEAQFIRAVLDTLSRAHGSGKFSAQIWKQSGLLEVIRAEPQLTKRGKHLPIIPAPG